MFSLCRDVFGEVGLVTVRVRLGRVSVGTCSAKSGYSREVFGVVVVVSGPVRRCRLSVWTFLARFS